MSNTIKHTVKQKSFRMPIIFGRGLLFTLLLSLFAINIATAQTTVYVPPADEVSIDNIENYVRNDSLFVAFDLALQGKFLATGNALHIRPVYRTERGELSLPIVLINGKQRASYYRREQALLSQDERVTNKPFAVIVRNDKETQLVAYNYVLPLPKGVNKTGTLHLEQLLQDCCDLALVNSQPLPIDYRQTSLDPAMFANTLTYIREEAEQAKNGRTHIVVRIDYPLNEFEVLPHFGNNQAELDKMDIELRPLLSSTESFQIDSAAIKGYASPEDTYEYNLNLSKRRTDSFRKFVIDT